MPAPLAEMRKHGGCGFFDGAACHVNERPVVFGAQPPRRGDFLGNRLPVDILVVIAMDFEPKESVLPNLHDALRRGVKPDHQRMLESSQARGQRHAGY